MTDLKFDDAEYVPSAGGPGRSKPPNPFTDVVAEIALKIDGKTGKPLAKKFTFSYEPDNEDDYMTQLRKWKRLLSEAGAANTPPVTVRSVTAPVKNPVNGIASKNKSTMTFWTIKRQVREGKTTTTLPQTEGTDSDKQ